jgi:SAM-dependent methyltransferase
MQATRQGCAAEALSASAIRYEGRGFMRMARNFEFDAAYYTTRYADLSHMSAQEAADHFVDHGIKEGRQGHPRGSRPTFVEHIVFLNSILEIGPFNAPIARGDNVRYLDVLDAAQLRSRAEACGLDPNGCPNEIHYIGDIADINDTFEGVISSHCIEHQPDLIHHLNGVARLLPVGGFYFLYIPDKRFCFDHFLPESTIAEVVQAHEDRRESHLLRSVIEHHALVTHNDARRHWAGDHGTESLDSRVSRINWAIEHYRNAKEYIDVHTWYFTPDNFWEITSTLHRCNLSPLKPVAVYPTLRDELEFFAILRREH